MSLQREDELLLHMCIQLISNSKLRKHSLQNIFLELALWVRCLYNGRMTRKRKEIGQSASASLRSCQLIISLVVVVVVVVFVVVVVVVSIVGALSIPLPCLEVPCPFKQSVISTMHHASLIFFVTVIKYSGVRCCHYRSRGFLRCLQPTCRLW